MAAFSIESADDLRRAVGELVRAVRLTEDVPEGQVETLGFLVRDGAQSIASLARQRRIRHQSMSATIAELEARGFVIRSSDPADARGVLIELTSAGSAMILESRRRRSSLILRAAERALTDEERLILAGTPELFDKLIGALDTASPSATS